MILTEKFLYSLICSNELIKKVKSVNDDNFVELILNKIISLENDTKYENFITKHPAEESLDKFS